MSTILMGRIAPKFSAKAVVKGEIVNNFSLDDFIGKYVVLFFYPMDFTFVCPTEIHAFQDKLSDFTNRNAVLMGCSVDSCYSHHAWLNIPKEKGGIQGVEYPLISDLNKTIARDYQVLEEESGIAYRGLFILDKNGVVRHQLINDFPIGRSVEEALRVLDALIAYEENGEVCPANWHAGQKTMKGSTEGVVQYFKS